MFYANIFQHQTKWYTKPFHDHDGKCKIGKYDYCGKVNCWIKECCKQKADIHKPNNNHCLNLE